MLFYGGNQDTVYWLVRMRAQILLTLLLVSSVFATMPANAQGRAIEFEVELSRYDWLSNETIPMDVQLKECAIQYRLYADLDACR